MQPFENSSWVHEDLLFSWFTLSFSCVVLSQPVSPSVKHSAAVLKTESLLYKENNLHFRRWRLQRPFKVTLQCWAPGPFPMILLCKFPLSNALIKDKFALRSNDSRLSCDSWSGVSQPHSHMTTETLHTKHKQEKKQNFTMLTALT